MSKEIPTADASAPAAPAPESNLPAEVKAPRIESRSIPTAVLNLLRQIEMEKQPIQDRLQAALASHFLTIGLEADGTWKYDLRTGQISRQVPE